jgi:hypothetical protein
MNVEFQWGFPNSQNGPQNYNENGDPGPWGSPKFYDTGVYLCGTVLAPGRMSARSAAWALFSEFLPLL